MVRPVAEVVVVGSMERIWYSILSLSEPVAVWKSAAGTLLELEKAEPQEGRDDGGVVTGIGTWSCAE